MLKNIPKIVSPQLIKILCEMGHGDEIVIADGNFPSETNGQRVVRADGIGGEEMLDAVLSLIPLDTYATENLLLMQTTNGDPTPTIWDKYFAIAKNTTTIFAPVIWNVSRSMKELKRLTRSSQRVKAQFTPT